ncbi:MAG: LacI family DNA-binding transcriptional regulator [Alkalibacterium gilvum]|uniref:Transcriptional regulator, LacI family n=1 Tax=Alkalibacterium gilvum TaxID=1130080 RepID=A0A1H6V3N3_9LACT|nr:MULTISPECIES: LacI family DNA-binding transcriptional regulator [Alkalibacterium]MDN6193588.1 LacI family DNA-binding transcriptional regulator [Alkalibacterium sp.]MDN6293720.1 LacI family DNA-binding transcriptional regulator [Alkalibacterium sp.]MDN6295430.1 LacI family DNA-binding transcriptional regulator [Alkalibacterium sp.]MDN6398017.1 LacI family DNA-binding transcriptional regulator [Alkalibacterium sp.]MDN6729914.1 LacI family DNA-binding transcriptional regulator [Alkalibacteriu
MVTINDIAKEAGVAKSTVSRYLNNGSVSTKTQKKIDEIVKKRGYKPNTFARSLKAQKTNMVGVIIPRLDSPSTNEVLSGIDAKAHEMGYQLIITNANQDNQREIDYIYSLAKQKVDGIILLAKEITLEHRKAITDVKLPFLVIGQNVEGIPTIVHDDFDAGSQVAKHALKLGHENILYFTVSKEDKAVGQDRLQGFIEETDKNKQVKVKVIETSFIMREAYETALLHLEKNKNITFIVGATDSIAIAIIKAAHALDVKVPEKASVAGYGGYDLLSFVTPALTTVKYKYIESGTLALETLNKMILKEAILDQLQLSNQLIIRETTKKIK